MRFFFRSKQFKIILAVFLSVVLLTVVSRFVGQKMAPTANIAGTIVAPFQSLAKNVSDFFKNLAVIYTNGNEATLENTRLESEINELRGQLSDYEKITAENEFYKEYLGLKEANPDFSFAPATLISVDSDDPYKGFLINEGSSAGIELYDPVITEAGVVGYISELGTSTAKVTTILSHTLTMGALDNRTSDSGLVSGTIRYAENNRCKFYNLSRSCSVAIGDYVVTSGEGIFPDGLIIGEIESIGSNEVDNSIYAVVSPFVDFSNIKNVMVITEFDGQGGLNAK
ncbi:MAG: rod shape-determining protein MreC [Ruminococcaceae bacterium]|nr:rod shape-determining protein MreC [Oscillospiraceae bacterium]